MWEMPARLRSEHWMTSDVLAFGLVRPEILSYHLKICNLAVEEAVHFHQMKHHCHVFLAFDSWGASELPEHQRHLVDMFAVDSCRCIPTSR